MCAPDAVPDITMLAFSTLMALALVRASPPGGGLACQACEGEVTGFLQTHQTQSGEGKDSSWTLMKPNPKLFEWKSVGTMPCHQWPRS